MAFGNPFAENCSCLHRYDPGPAGKIYDRGTDCLQPVHRQPIPLPGHRAGYCKAFGPVFPEQALQLPEKCFSTPAFGSIGQIGQTFRALADNDINTDIHGQEPVQLFLQADDQRIPFQQLPEDLRIDITAADQERGGRRGGNKVV